MLIHIRSDWTNQRYADTGSEAPLGVYWPLARLSYFMGSEIINHMARSDAFLPFHSLVIFINHLIESFAFMTTAGYGSVRVILGVICYLTLK